MGIEPTDRVLDTRSNGFEDRGRHQACRHFPESDFQSGGSRTGSGPVHSGFSSNASLIIAE